MALVACGQLLWPNPNPHRLFAGALSTSANYQINGSGQRIGAVVQMPASGTVTKVGVRINTCATAKLSRLGLYTVDGSGNPTSTLYGGSNYATFTPAANTYSEVTLGTSATATAGDFAALVVEFDSVDFGDMFLSVGNSNAAYTSFPKVSKYNGSAWAHYPVPILGHIYYSDGGGYYAPCGLAPFTGREATATYNVNTAGADEYGLKVAVPFACRVAGVWTTFSNVAGANHEVIVYSGTTAQRTLAIDGDLPITGDDEIRMHFFSSGYTVAAGATVRAAIRPTTTSNVTYRRYTLYAANSEQSLGVPQGTCESTRVDSGAWSDTTTNIPAIGLILDQLDDGASAGGLLRHPGMSGGALG